jgi:hypothetical protein
MERTAYILKMEAIHASEASEHLTTRGAEIQMEAIIRSTSAVKTEIL